MPETRNILFLGVSYAGSGAAHYFGKHILPKLPKSDGITYRAIIIDPSSKWFLRHASPRALCSEDLIPTNQIFLNTEDGFKQYGEAVSFVQGSAIAWDDKARTVQIRKPDGSEETLAYYALIVATGTKTLSPLFAMQGTQYTENQEALEKIRKQLPTAKHIVIAGGGPAGVETAGEIGEMINGAAGWFSSRPSNPKVEITLYTASEKLLPVLRPAIAKQAEGYLNRVGVDVVYKTKIASAEETADGKTKVKLQDGKEVTADIYIPATGLIPMTDFVPKHLLNEKNFIKNNAETMRIDEAGPRVYAVGDATSTSRKSIIDILGTVPVLGANLKRDLLAAHEKADAKPTGDDKKWKPSPEETQLVPIGSKGVGALFGYKLPSVMVWAIKGRNYMITESGVRDKLMGADWKKE